MTNINSATQAAEALRPLAGNFTFVAVRARHHRHRHAGDPGAGGLGGLWRGRSFGWPATLEAKAPDAVGFYAIIAAATVIGFGLGFTGIDAIHMLVWSAVLNGIVAVPIMAMMMVIVANVTLMGRFRARRSLIALGWDRNRADGAGGGRSDRIVRARLSDSAGTPPLLHTPALKEALVSWYSA